MRRCVELQVRGRLQPEHVAKGVQCGLEVKDGKRHEAGRRPHLAARALALT